MLSLRLAARSLRVASVAPSRTFFVVARHVSSITRVPRLSTTSVVNAAQRRAFSDLAAAEYNTDRPKALHRGPDGHPLQPTDTLYVGNMQFDTKEEDLKEFFSACGEVTSVKIIYDVKGLSKGFGYVQFADLNTAIRACEDMNNQLFLGRRINVQFLAKPHKNNMIPSEPTKTLFIGNMNYEMTDDDINELFKEIKNCIDVRVAMDRRTGQPRGFAHADFTDVESAIAAKEKLSGRIFFGRALRIDFSAGAQRNADQRQAPQ